MDWDIKTINSITKYPAIPTYHALGEKGRLTEEVPVDFGDGPVVVTEKIDGTNARIVCFPDGDYAIGSREHLLYARGDRIGDPAMGIVEALRPIADRLARIPYGPVYVYYGEVYGGTIGKAARQYGGPGSVGFRLFDVQRVLLEHPVFAMAPDAIARWRDEGGQDWMSEESLNVVTGPTNLSLVPLIAKAGPLPRTVAGTLSWLRATIDRTCAALDPEAKGTPEGVVVRSPDRKKIAKLRFEDYERSCR